MNDNLNKINIIIYFLKRQEDHFAGLKEIFNKFHINYKIIQLDESDYRIIQKIEYSKFKLLLRIIYYPRILKKIEIILKKELSNFLKANIFFSDEGIWGIFLSDMKYRCKTELTLVNIQHGLFLIKKPRYIYLRKKINKIFKVLFGYPLIGLDFGGACADIYFVYGEEEKKYLSKRNKKPVVLIAPYLCKYDLIKKYNREKHICGIKDSEHILFAMQKADIAEGFLYSEKEIYKMLLPFLHYLKECKKEIYLRLHPGIPDNKNSLRWLKEYGILDMVKLANSKDLSYYLVRSNTVISFHSTVLFDAYILGLLPISITGMARDYYIPFEHEKLDIKRDWMREFNLACEKRRKYQKDKKICIEDEIINYIKEISND
jgi:hypothetical protein